MTKSTIIKEKTDIFKLIYYDYVYQPPGTSEIIKNSEEKKNQSSEIVITRQEKLEIEHSQTYIGYKLMWVMKMFLEGKKFP